VTRRQRPGPLRWIAYAFGRPLPARYREWVLHDVTAPTWLLRHVARILTQLALPIAAELIFLPASIGLRLMVLAAAVPPVVMGSMLFSVERGEHMLVKAGYPAGTGEKTRQERALRTQYERAAAWRDKRAQRFR
jgi:hypothetical protein